LPKLFICSSGSDLFIICNISLLLAIVHIFQWLISMSNSLSLFEILFAYVIKLHNPRDKHQAGCGCHLARCIYGLRWFPNGLRIIIAGDSGDGKGRSLIRTFMWVQCARYKLQHKQT
jgi:hypothetical protein